MSEGDTFGNELVAQARRFHLDKGTPRGVYRVGGAPSLVTECVHRYVACCVARKHRGGYVVGQHHPKVYFERLVDRVGEILDIVGAEKVESPVSEFVCDARPHGRKGVGRVAFPCTQVGVAHCDGVDEVVEQACVRQEPD